MPKEVLKDYRILLLTPPRILSSTGRGRNNSAEFRSEALSCQLQVPSSTASTASKGESWAGERSATACWHNTPSTWVSAGSACAELEAKHPAQQTAAGRESGGVTRTEPSGWHWGGVLRATGAAQSNRQESTASSSKSQVCATMVKRKRGTL